MHVSRQCQKNWSIIALLLRAGERACAQNLLTDYDGMAVHQQTHCVTKAARQTLSVDLPLTTASAINLDLYQILGSSVRTPHKRYGRLAASFDHAYSRHCFPDHDLSN